MGKYPVKRGNRYDRLCVALVHDLTFEGMEELDGGADDADLHHRTMDYAVLSMAGNEILHQYARIVIYSGQNGDGSRVMLKTTDGVDFTIPEKNAPKTELAIGFTNWMQIDEREQDEIDFRIIEANKPPAPRHSLPPDQLSEQEKSDPNSSGEGANPKKK